MSSALSQEFLDRARKCLKQAEDLFAGVSYLRDYPLAISRAHECLEFSLKSALLTIDSRYSHTHDVGDDLIKSISKFPDWFQKKAPCFALRSKIISIIRNYSIYGYEVTKTPAKELFGEHDAKMCIENAKEVLFSCERLFHETKSRSKSPTK
jgi:HEPN domain-containing protein